MAIWLRCRQIPNCPSSSGTGGHFAVRPRDAFVHAVVTSLASVLSNHSEAAMAAIPEPRTPHEHHAPKCHRHHTWMAGCPLCAEWHRDQLRTEREAAQQRQAQREAAT